MNGLNPISFASLTRFDIMSRCRVWLLLLSWQMKGPLRTCPGTAPLTEHAQCAPYSTVLRRFDGAAALMSRCYAQLMPLYSGVYWSYD